MQEREFVEVPGIFKTMAEGSIIQLSKGDLEDGTKTHSVTTRSKDYGCSLLEKESSLVSESNMNGGVPIVETCTDSHTTPSRASESEGPHSLTHRDIHGGLEKTTRASQVDAALSVDTLDPQTHNVNDEENNLVSTRLNESDDAIDEDVSCHVSKPDNKGLSDAEIVRRAHEEGRIEVVLPGSVTQEGCCRFVSEILKCILYQRQQLPMTYDQLVFTQKKTNAPIHKKEVVNSRPTDFNRRKCQRTVEDLEVLLEHLELLFSLSLVPRVLLLLGGSPVLPQELYEVNMEGLVLAAGDGSLRVSSCLRQLFRTIFVSDLLSDVRPVRLTATTVLVLAHRDCEVGWFRPKLDFKVPTRVKRQIIALSTDAGIGSSPQKEESNWEDYVWFQAPVAIKGFSK
ncbi:MAD2L1-binding protein [Gadus morhua]|uniref:MAD2L1 binding protein n=1 Tax=Gadus morhua TaxID=8049 RepID=A0A8C4ZRL9_GADMO|nr:MAD2L1-binding protein [Gadus morhua]